MMHKFLVFLFIASAVLLPPISLGGSLPTVRPEMLPVLAGILFGGRRIGIDLGRRDPVWAALLWLIPIALVAIVTSYAVMRTPFNYRDFMVIPMLVQYWLAYCFARSLARPDVRRFAMGSVVLCVGLSALVGIAQRFNLAGVNNWLTPLYTSDLEVRALREGLFFGRSVGTVGDPRHYAYLLAVGVVATATMLLLSRSRLRDRVTQLSVLVACLLALILTASRTGVVAAAIGIFLVFHLSQKKTGQVAKTVALVVVGGIMVSTLWNLVAPEGAKERLADVNAGSFQNSLGARQRDALEPFVEGLKNPLIFITGRGPSKAVLPGSEHSDMGWFLLRYGSFGIGCYLYMIIGGMRRALSRFRSAFDPMEAAVALWTASAIALWLIFAQAESIFKEVQLMSLNIFVLGLIFAPPWIHGYPARPLPHRRSTRMSRGPEPSSNQTPGGHRRNNPSSFPA